MKRFFAVTAALLLILSSCTGQVEKTSSDTAAPTAQPTAETESRVYMPTEEESFTERDVAGAYDEGTARIVFTADGVQTEGEGVKSSGSTCVISAEGVYITEGESTDARIEVRAGDKAKVQIVLSGVNLTSESGSVIYTESAKKVFITLADGTENVLADTENYPSDTKEDGVIFSKSDLTINGKGSLTVRGNYAHGIVSKDDLIITGGTYDVQSVKTAFSGKDCIRIADGTFTVSAGTDAFKSSNTDDSDKGYIYVYGGTYSVNAASDAFNAASSLMIADGSYTIQTSSGSAGAEHKTESFGRGGPWDEQQSTSDGVSAKGLKAGATLYVAGGKFNIDTLDDAIHTEGSMYLYGGKMNIEAGDDALHADNDVVIDNCELDIKTCYEGIEAVEITINSGDISITAYDDGINANGEERQAEGTLTINGGRLCLTSGGDGLDSNGYIYVNGGTVMVSGPENNGNSALDYGAKGVVTGGTLIICGSSGMAQNFGSESTQCALMCNIGTQSAGTRISCVDKDGNIIVSFAPTHSFASVIFSSDKLTVGETYSIITGGECTADEYGFAEEGTLAGGTNLGEVTLTRTASTFGSGRK